MPRYAVRLAVAVLVAAAAGLGASSPAQAATCGGAKGVSVVVDFHQLGGGVQTFCDAGAAGMTADAQLRDAGHRLTYVQRQPGFICRIDAQPADDPCVNTPPADAYWSLWWSDGKSGKWLFSSVGAGSLKVPEGGYVAMSWQGGDGKAQPGVSPTAHVIPPSSSAPTQSPSSPSSPQASTAPGQASSSSTAMAPATSTFVTPGPAHHTGQGKQHVDPSKVGKAKRKDTQRPDPIQAGEPLQQAAADAPGDTGGSGSGLPGWVAPLAIAALFAGAGTIALLRRRTSGGA